jgi:hypothetical protein
MKKLLLIIVAVCFTLTQLVAQEPVFSKGNKVLNLGIGLGSTLYSGTFYRTTLPPISASLEFGVVDNVLEKGSIGVGPYVGFSSHKWEYSGWGYKYTNIVIGARGSFHYPLVKKLDTYTGILLGYDIVSASEFGTLSGYDYTASSSGIAWSWFIGGRYWFNDKVAGLLELGYGIAYLNLGVAFKF